MDNIFSNPRLLEEMTPQQVKELAQAEGWQVDTLRRGSQIGKRLIVREVDDNGRLTGRMIQWHPGGGHHGNAPYWKVSSPGMGTIRIGSQFK